MAHTFIVSQQCLHVQAYEFAFNPSAGLDALDSNLRPVSAGTLPILPAASGGGNNIDFTLMIRECFDAADAVFSTWPQMEAGTGYFALFALGSQYGALNEAFEGAVASTTQQ